jgi:hypothetical protein
LSFLMENVLYLARSFHMKKASAAKNSFEKCLYTVY